MPQSMQITPRDILDDILPKVKATERVVNNTLKSMLEAADDSAERRRLENQVMEFELEITMIMMNLEHLMNRYAMAFQEVTDAGHRRSGPVLELDQHEVVAIESARKLYERIQEVQRADTSPD
ncbi:hypothetical protein [Aidingimonas halophila]|uniref:Uncharacterized protein n=2 Tax=Aidingimonas halophila TaxID=574349 RepID=A0A1H3D6K2_9GAMM|nr:hypothetical protein [Aidingimonas halophila]GHC30449.1 hypothetical protein GCM10008094_23450 [Aidingimonas halophila]SDX62083.1 hypothetical protein SAMN05443545_106205 [Aidingimonas halophila]